MSYSVSQVPQSKGLHSPGVPIVLSAKDSNMSYTRMCMEVRLTGHEASRRYGCISSFAAEASGCGGHGQGAKDGRKCDRELHGKVGKRIRRLSL